MSTQLIITWIFAIVFGGIGVGSLIHLSYIRRMWPKTVGRVVDNVGESKRVGAAPRQATYFAKISFMARDGQRYVVKGDVGKTEPWRIGAAIDLWYKEKNPEHVVSAKPWQQIAFSAGFIGVAAACWAKIGGLIG